jgi:hypothetical protein
LVQNNYIETDTDDVLEEFDERILCLNNLPHLSIDELLGIGYYSLWRMSGNSVRKYTILKNVLPKIIRLMEERCDSLNCTYQTVLFLKKIIETDNNSDLLRPSVLPHSLQLCRKKNPYGLEINTYNRFLGQFTKNDSFEKHTFDLSFRNGLAGFGMALMTELAGDDTWISLFPNDLTHL